MTESEVDSREPAATSTPWTLAVLKLLEDWDKRAAASSETHYALAGRLAGRNIQLGVPVVVLTTIVGTSVFATLQEEVTTTWRIAVGTISVIAAVLASVQTFLRFAERAERHRVVAARYGSIKRRAEQLLVAGGVTSEADISDLREQTDRLTEEAPQINQYVIKSIRKELGYATDAEARVIATS